MTMHCRLLPDRDERGSWQMAADEVLLTRAVEQQQASLRFYTWREPTLSLGYFQPHAERLPDVAWLRRPTGGAAIMHHHEWTYALALPAGKPWHDNESWLCRFHHVIQRALKSWNIASHAVVCGEEQKLGPVLCFLHQTPGDVLIDGHKVIGSAQRRPHGAMLQHGSILLRQSLHAPQLLGIEDLTQQTIPMADLKQAIVAQFQKELAVPLVADEWTTHEADAITLVEQSKYALAEWNEKR